MSGFDQLGLFATSSDQKSTPKSYQSPRQKINFRVDVDAGIAKSKMNELLENISSSVKKIDDSSVVNLEMINESKPWNELPFLALDVETTGLDAAGCRVIELAAVPFNMSIDEQGFDQLFSVNEPLSPEITNITGITDDMIRNQPKFEEKVDDFLSLLPNAAFILAYNSKFDRPFVESELARAERVLPEIPWVDPFIFICEFDRFKRGKKLADSARRWGVDLQNAHRAKDDARAAGELMLKMVDAVGSCSLEELLTKQKLLQWRDAQQRAQYKKNNGGWSISR